MPEPKRIVVDIDDTICKHRPEDSGDDRFINADPITDMIDKVNQLYEEGWYVIYHTARGMVSRDGCVDTIYDELYEITKEWLQRHNVLYHELVMGKPYGDYYLDDKSLTIEEFREMF